MDQNTLFIISVILIAYIFDFINGFHDASNAIATIVTTGVLTPRQAVLWSAFFSLIAFAFFNLMVAKTVGYGLIDTHIIDAHLIFAALIGAIFWNLITWYFGLPSSSTQALIGGMVGAALVKGGIASLKLVGLMKVAIGIIISPLLGLAVSLLFTCCLSTLLRDHHKDKLQPAFKGFQLLSSALLSLTHGSNDAQKTMGIITLLLFSNAWLQGPFSVPFWVVISCQAVISLGTLCGGWRIVKTMGTKITKLDKMNGCMAESSAAAVIFSATEFGIPVSTTQTVTGAIAGVGFVKGLNGSHWPTIRLILLSWLLTIPAAGLVAGSIMILQ